MHRLCLCAAFSLACVFAAPLVWAEQVVMPDELKTYFDDADTEVIAVDFFAHWCPPCAESMPEWQALVHEIKPPGLKVVMVDVGSDGEPCETLSWKPHHWVCDRDDVVSEQLPFEGIPQIYVWHRDGRLLYDGSDVFEAYTAYQASLLPTKPLEPETYQNAVQGPALHYPPMCYGVPKVGQAKLHDVVQIRRQRVMHGSSGWGFSMERYIGEVATITRFTGIDDEGCITVNLNIDDGDNRWRLRDLQPLYPAPQQSAAPESCGEDAHFGSVDERFPVLVQAHHPGTESTNWTASMDDYVGALAKVTEFGKADASGCLTVKLSVDGGQHWWRAIDLGPILTDSWRAQLEQEQEEHDECDDCSEDEPVSLFGAPQECPTDGAALDYGPIVVGAEVSLGTPRAIADEDEIDERLYDWVGSAARILELGGADEYGCPWVTVAVSDVTLEWRVRDLFPPDDVRETLEDLQDSAGEWADEVDEEERAPGIFRGVFLVVASEYNEELQPFEPGVLVTGARWKDSQGPLFRPAGTRADSSQFKPISGDELVFLNMKLTQRARSLAKLYATWYRAP
ncbi:MAG: TlpA disulfide reductase family protein [Myxococcota bacterium]|nr:TlpA disulfide reductase family protein [Myxococcota bacterium]